MVAVTNVRRARTSTMKMPKPTVTPQSEPSQDDIRIRAYQLYSRRVVSGIDGDETSDWIEAERQLLQEV